MTESDTWNAAQYVRFEAERNRPASDLLAAVPDLPPGATVVDIGCGPGNSTALLSRRFPEARVGGIDSSADMIAAARMRLPDVRFDVADIGGWNDPGPFDLILANAVLQWLPGNDTLLPRLIGKLKSGGSLAVQMPDNLDEPAHRLMRTIAAAGPWASKLTGAADARAPRHDADWYYARLRGLARVDIWRTTYHHPLANADAIVEWFLGTGLRPFLDPLDEAERAAFLGLYRTAVAEAYPAFDDGSVLLPFPRLFFIATRQPSPKM